MKLSCRLSQFYPILLHSCCRSLLGIFLVSCRDGVTSRWMTSVKHRSSLSKPLCHLCQCRRRIVVFRKDLLQCGLYLLRGDSDMGPFAPSLIHRRCISG